MQKILVTGGLGFIGSHFTRLLVADGCLPVIISRCSLVSDVRRLRGIDKDKFKVYIGDICNSGLCEEIINRNNIDIIVNFAAETHVDRSIAGSDGFIHSNVVGAHCLFELARRYDLKTVQVSTDEVYGSIEKGAFTEEDRLNPSNPYSATKAAADLLAVSYYKTYGLDICITRSCNNYGEYQYPEKFTPKMILNAVNGRPLTVYGNGKNVREWMHVTDNCTAIKIVMEKGKKGEIYNIGSGEERSNNEIAGMLSGRFGAEIEYIEDRPGHDNRYSVECGKIKETLGWKPLMKFEDGMELTIQHYIIENDNLYRGWK